MLLAAGNPTLAESKELQTQEKINGATGIPVISYKVKVDAIGFEFPNCPISDLKSFNFRENF